MINQNGSITIIVGLVILLIIIGGGAYYLGTQKVFNSTQNLSLPTPTSPPCYGEDYLNSVYPKRQFDIKSIFIDNQNYPSQITSFCDNQLAGMICLDPYTRQTDGTYKFTETKKEGGVITSTVLTVTQEDVLDNIHRISRKLDGRDPDKIRYCDIGRGDLLAEYELWENGRESNNEAKFALLYAQGGVKEITSIPNYGVPYFTCDKPLLLTGTNDLYVECSGGDGTPISKTIYKININEKVDTEIILNSEIIKCTQQNKTSQSEVICQQSIWQNHNIQLYKIGVSLPSDWSLIETNKRPEPEGMGTVYGHDCAEYQAKNLDGTTLINLKPSCEFDEGTGNTLPNDAVIIKKIDSTSELVRVFSNTDGVYVYGTNSATGPKNMSYLPVISLGKGQGLIIVRASFQYTGSTENKNITLETVDKIIDSLKKL